MRLPWIKTSLMVGLDIRPENLYLVQLKKHRRQWFIKEFVHSVLSPQTLIDGRITDWDEVVATLTPLVESRGLKGMPAAISLPQTNVHLQELSLPLGLDGSGIEAEIKLALQHDFPGLVDMFALDYFILPGSNDMKVVYVVTRQEDVAQYVAAINATGLQLKIIDVDHYALERFVNNKQYIKAKSDDHSVMNDYAYACGMAMREVPAW